MIALMLKKNNPNVIFFIILLTSYQSTFAQIQTTDIWTYEFVKTPNHSLKSNFLKKIKTAFNSKVFIETGTYAGDTTITAAEIYDRVLTVELSEKWYKLCLERFNNISNIKAYLGTSTEFLKHRDNYKLDLDYTTFWLDAHWSGKGTAKNGTENTPVASEIDLINASTQLPIILIDDIRFFQPHYIQPILDSDSTGYPSLTELNHKITTTMPLHELVIYGDIAIIYPKNTITFSNTVLNMTTSLLHFDDNNSDISQIAELQIAHEATKTEQAEIIKLYERFESQPLLIEHLKIWYAMVKIGQKKYAEALKILESIDKDYSHRKLKRIKYYKTLCSSFLQKKIKNESEISVT